MTLRARLAVLTAAAVALAIVVASIVAWTLIRQSLLAEVDRRLLERTPSADLIAMSTAAQRQGGGQLGDLRVVLNTDPLGIQLIAPDGTVTARLDPADLDLDLDAAERSLLAGDREGQSLRTVTIGGDSFRVLSTSVSGGGMLRLIQPLDGVESTMTRIAWLLAAVSLGGMAVAGGLGWATARAGLSPVGRLVTAAERVAATKDLSPRLDVDERRGDEVTRLASTFNDMLAALEEARAQQRELVENASHELRTPLTTLRNDVALLLRSEQDPNRALDDADRAALLANLEAETVALSQLVAEVVDLARGDSRPEPLEHTALLPLVGRAATRTQRIDPEVTVEVRGDDADVAVRPVALERAVANLLRNAVQATEPGGVVEVAVAAGDDWATVEVLDRGPGIAEEDLPRIFDRFYRSHTARSRPGSGLGLAIVAQVAEQHGGTVTARNRPGGGAAFTLRVPRMPDATEAPPAA